jgi:DNA-directed RNA polymerase specialized sigma24 family protein
MEAAIAGAISFGDSDAGGVEIVDARADVERLVLLRDELRLLSKVSRQLSTDQRLVLASQVSSDKGCGEFCRVHGWSAEKYRKVAQRARVRLTRLLADQATLTGRQAEMTVPVLPPRRIREQELTYDHNSPK